MRRLLFILAFTIGLAPAFAAAPPIPPPAPLGFTPAFVFNVDKDYGAVGDFNQGRGASIAANSATLSGGTTSCAAADVGKTMLIPGAGVGGAALETTIASCSGSSYVLAASATYAAGLSNYWVGYAGVQVQADGTNCAPGDVLTLTGGTANLQGALTIKTCQVHSAAVNAAGSGGTTGGCVLTDAGTFTGEPFRIYATISGGSISALGAFLHKGDYSVNPSNLAAEPVTGCGLSGSPTLTLAMGVSQQVDPGSGVTVSSPGSYSTPPASPVAVGSSTGSESGETFNVYFPNGGIYSFGTNNYSAFNAALTAAATKGGGVMQMSCSGKYLLSGGSLAVGNGGYAFTLQAPVTLQGCANIEQGGASGSVSGQSGAGLFFDPTGAAQIAVNINSTLSHVQIFNPLISWGYQSEPFRQSANRNASPSGTVAAVSLAGQAVLDEVFIGGYYLGVSESGQSDWKIYRTILDDTNGVSIVNLYDYSLIRDVYCHQVAINTGNGASVTATISAISNNGGSLEISTSAAPSQNGVATQFEVGDTVYVSGAGSKPNLSVTGYSTANGTWTVSQVIDATDYVLANSGAAATSGQSYVSGGTLGWYPIRQGTCVYYNGIGSGNDGLWVEDTIVNGWLHGIHAFGSQGQHYINDAMNGYSQDPNQIGLWLDGATKDSEVIGGEFQQMGTALLDTTYGATSQGTRLVAGQFLSNGYGPAINHEGTVPLSITGWQTAANGAGWINIGDGAGQMMFGGASSLVNQSFSAQSYSDWANLVIAPDAVTGGSQSLTGGFVLPPSPMNLMGASTGGANNPLGACDVGQAPAVCYGLRRELSTYTGPLVNVTRASDSATLAIGQDAFGNLNQALCAAFQGSSTLTVNTWYDQSGGGLNATQTTAADQPTLLCAASKLAGKPAIVYANGSVNFLTVGSSANWQGWAAGSAPGSILVSILATANATNADRIFEINGGGGVNSLSSGIVSGTTEVSFSAGYTTTTGAWTSSGNLSTSSMTVLDYTYQWTLTTNAPTIDYNGASQSFGSTTPVGTAGVDTGQTFTIGGIGNSSTTLNGYVDTFVIWKAGPGAAQLEQARKAEGAYYGVTVN